MRSEKDLYRLAVERENLRHRLPQFQFSGDSDELMVEGWQQVGSHSTKYKLCVPIPAHYPHEHPPLYVVSPQALPTRDGNGTINALGGSVDLVTHDNGPEGCVSICHASSASWHASQTLVSVCIKGIYWLTFYEAYLLTGKSIRFFFEEWKKRHSP